MRVCIANYQEALRSVKYNHQGPFLSSKSLAVSFTANDGSSDSSAAIVNINMDGCTTGNPPTVDDISKEGKVDTIISFSKKDFTNKFNDADSEDTLKQIEVVSLPEYGILKLAGSGEATEGQKILAEDLDDLLFTPNDKWTGKTSFKWKGFDCQSSSDEADVTIDINDIAPKWYTPYMPYITAAGTAAVVIPFTILSAVLVKKAQKCKCCFKKDEPMDVRLVETETKEDKK